MFHQSINQSDGWTNQSKNKQKNWIKVVWLELFVVCVCVGVCVVLPPPPPTSLSLSLTPGDTGCNFFLSKVTILMIFEKKGMAVLVWFGVRYVWNEWMMLGNQNNKTLQNVVDHLMMMMMKKDPLARVRLIKLFWFF